MNSSDPTADAIESAQRIPTIHALELSEIQGGKRLNHNDGVHWMHTALLLANALTAARAEVERLQRLVDIYVPKPKAKYVRPERPFRFTRTKRGYNVVDKATGTVVGQVWSTYHGLMGDSWNNSAGLIGMLMTRDDNALALWEAWNATPPTAADADGGTT